MGAYCLLFAIDSGWVEFDDRFRLDQSGDCIDSGDDPGDEGMAFYTTALDNRCDVPPVDIGYHYPGVVRFVDASKTGGDGLSWDTAYQYLQDALDEAGSEIITGIAVAKGTYKPGGTRSSSFELVSDTGVYGGLTNLEGVFQERDPQANVTILSGDIDAPGTDTDNCYHVVVGADNAILDGFTITKGYADGGGNDDFGGGMLNLGVSPQVVNCTFEDNLALTGGGVCNYESSASFRYCRFVDNYAYVAGGGLGNLSCSSMSLENCLFDGNTAWYDTNADRYYDSGEFGQGGGVYNEDSTDMGIINCTFYGNLALEYGGGILEYASNGTVVKNSIMWNDISSLGSETGFDFNSIYLLDGSGTGHNISISYSDIKTGEDGIDKESGCEYTWTNNIESDPLFADAAGGDFHLQSEMGRWDVSSWYTDAATSPCINAGDPASGYSLEPEDNGGRINMGAYGNTGEASKSDLYPFSYTLQTDDIYLLPTEAAWNVSGGSVNMSDLSNGEIVMIPAGEYTVSFDCDNGTPYIVDVEGQSKTVTSSSVNYYTATYQACGVLQISTYCPPSFGYGGNSWGRWSCDGGSTWNYPYNAASSFTKVLSGTYTIKFETLQWLNTPSDINLTVSTYGVEQQSVTYYLQNVYVDPVSGSDSNIGLSQSPVETITNAAEKVKTSGTVYVTNYESEFWHEGAQEYRGRINENVSLNKHVEIHYTGPQSYVHIFGTHSLDPPPSTSGVIFE